MNPIKPVGFECQVVADVTLSPQVWSRLEQDTPPVGWRQIGVWWGTMRIKTGVFAEQHLQVATFTGRLPSLMACMSL